MQGRPMIRLLRTFGLKFCLEHALGLDRDRQADAPRRPPCEERTLVLNRPASSQRDAGSAV